MATKSRRMETRVDEETHELIARAAAASDESVSAFVSRAVRTEADRILARADTTLMPAEQFDALIGSMDQPDEASALSRAAVRARRIVRT